MYVIEARCKGVIQITDTAVQQSHHLLFMLIRKGTFRIVQTNVQALTLYESERKLR